MTWTYAGDPSVSEIASYRFKIGDTVVTEPVLQDEEIQYVLDTYTGEYLRLYRLFEAMYLYFIRGVKRVLGPQQEDPTERQRQIKAYLDEYKKKAGLYGTPTQTGPTTEKIFGIGMQSNA